MREHSTRRKLLPDVGADNHFAPTAEFLLPRRQVGLLDMQRDRPAVLVGEVWICSGQSNLARGLRGGTL